LTLAASQSWLNAASNALVVEGNVSGAGDLALHAGSVGGIVLSGLVNHAGSISNNGTGTGTTTISGVIGTNVTGVTQDSATSKLILAGTNTYTGNTTVAEGGLIVSGSIASSALTSVQSGGTLSGGGTVGNTIILSGGTGSPGNSPGMMTVSGDLTFMGGGNYNWEIHDAEGAAGQLLGWDLYQVSGILDLGALTLGSKFNINLWSLSAVSPDANGAAINFDNTLDEQSWDILVAVGGITGFDAADFNIRVNATNGTGGFANALAPAGFFGIEQNGNVLSLTYTVPEPSTYALLALAAGAAGYVRWHNRKKVS
jgi:autotransporter-associated beta strand protein